MEPTVENAPKTNAQLCAQANIWLGRYAEVSAKLDAQRAARKPLEEELVKLRGKLQDWAEDSANQSLFADSQTLNLAVGSIGFKNGPERIEFELDSKLTEPERTAAIVAALERYHADGVKKTYDEKQLLKAWPVLPKLRALLKDVIKGTTRASSFAITLKKVAPEK